MRVFQTALLVSFCAAATQTAAQSLDLSITDPDAIAAECGGEANAGKELFAVSCASCHAVQGDTGLTLAGPHLEGLFGRTVASLPEFSYTPTLVAEGATGTFWERETLHAFLTDPAASPSHPVVGDEQARRDILTYLRTVTLPPPPAPGELEIPEEAFTMAGDVAYGEYLGGECAGCHVAGSDTVPGIVGLDRRYFITALHEYRARARSNQTMQIVAARLGDEEMASLAAYFETLE